MMKETKHIFGSYKRAAAAALTSALLLTPVLSLAESAVIRGGALNLRKEPSKSAAVLGQYPTGTWVTIHEQGDTWSRVTVNGKSGYMMTKYLSSGARNGTLYVRTNTGIGLNLRNAPSTEGDIITSFKPGTQVKVLKRGNGWHYVSVNGKEGYMSSKFLSAYNVSYTKPVKSFTATLKNINGGSVVNFRLYPGMKTKIIGVYPVGTKVTVLEMGDNWSKVEIDGKTGYVSTYFLKY